MTKPTINWKIALSVLVLAAPMLRACFGRPALKYLHTQVLISSKPVAFYLLSRLGWRHDPVFVWYLLDLLLKVPENSFDDPWLKLALAPIDDLPGVTVHERIHFCQKAITQAFGLWCLAGKVAKVGIDYEKIADRISASRHQ